MTRRSISRGVYVADDGRFWSRPRLHGKSTWRLLQAITQRAAIKEHANTRFEPVAGRFADLAQLYLDAQCPNRRLEPRPEPFCRAERPRVAALVAYFGPRPAAEIDLAMLPKYADWRRRQCRRGPGNRTVDLDLVTLSAILSYAVRLRLLPENRVRSDRPRYVRADTIRHSRQRAPVDADAIHRVAEHLLGDPKSETIAWFVWFAAFTGCRRSELLRLRLDAADTDSAGYVLDGCLFLGRRSKGGVNPWAMMGVEFEAMNTAFRRWHRAWYPKNPWYFPGRVEGPLHPDAPAHAIRRACQSLGIHPFSPHGLRSFYVTKRRSDGATDVVIAGEIGDQTVSLMQTTYGARPANWTGGKALSWLPSYGPPAWESPGKSDSGSDYGAKQALSKTAQVID